MTNSRASSILKALATGQYPDGGSAPGNADVLSEPDVIRALFLGASALEAIPSSDSSGKKDRSHLPAGAGRPWTEEEEEILKEEFDAGKGISEISEDHSRTEGGIRARLVKMGLMDERGKDPR